MHGSSITDGKSAPREAQNGRTNAREGKSNTPSATANGSNFACIRIKAFYPHENTVEHLKSEHKRKFKAREHNERESNTANTQSTAHNTPKTAHIERTAIKPYKHIAQYQ